LPPGRSVYDLIRDYLRAAELLGQGEFRLPKQQAARLSAFQRFVSVEGHKLAQRPEMLFPLAVAQPQDSPLRQTALDLWGEGGGPDRPWFRLLNPPPTDPNRAMLRVFEGHTEWVASVAFSPAGRQALSGSDDNTLRLWDVATGQELRRCEGHTNGVTSVAFSPDGRQALSGSGDRTLRLWDVATGQELRRCEGHTNTVTSVAFSPDGRQALSGSSDDTLRLWDVATGQELRRFEGHTNKVTSVAFSPDGRQALSGSWDKTLRLWDVDRGACLAVFTCNWPIACVAVQGTAPCRVAAGDRRGIVSLFEIEQMN
jgi:WD40 repeat protein